MRVEKDYEELLKLLNKNKVKYCVVGAYAVAFYATPRYTKDMDIFIKPSPENARRVIKALNEFGFKRLKLKEKDISTAGRIIQLGYEPIRVDIMTSIEGCSFEEVWKTKTPATYGKQKIFFIGIDKLLKNKRVSKRKQDKIDLDILLSAKRKP